MILVDTSVWSLAFRRRAWQGPVPGIVGFLLKMIEDDQPLAVPGIVLQELLSGVKEPSEASRLEDLMKGFPLLLATREHHVEGAKISVFAGANALPQQQWIV